VPPALRTTRPWILGLSLSHNGAACLLHGDEIVVAVQEERLTRRKRARLAPERRSLAVEYCLETAQIGAPDLAAIGVCSQLALGDARKEELLHNQLEIARHGTPVVTLSHHAGHAVHAFATSGFSDGAVLVVDGLGSPPSDRSAGDKDAALFGPRENGWESISLYRAQGCEIRALEKHLVACGEWLQKRPHGMPLFRSLGGMYSAAAQQIFGDEMEAGKVMGLAPFGHAEFPVAAFFEIRDGAFLFKDEVPEWFNHDRRWPGETGAYENLAASVQQALEHAILHLARQSAALTGSGNLCYAGGVALNVTTNERLHRESAFQNIYIPAAAEDSGPAIGAAYWALWSLSGVHTPKRARRDSYGRGYAADEVEAAMRLVPGLRLANAGEGILQEAAERLAGAEIGGWFQGGSELGPRALGHRSILCDPRDPAAKDCLNSKVKFREAFRPFAPAVLAEHAAHWFEVAPGTESEFMLRSWPVRQELRSKVPAIVHVDGTGRAQTVAREVNPRFHHLIAEFCARTGVPMLVNTSFNVRGEPIVETPEDALWCFLMTGIDFCVVEDRLIVKQEGRDALLHYRPRIVAQMQNTSGGTIACQAATRWGPREIQLSPGVAPLLALIDGRRTTRQVAQGLQRGTREPVPEAGVVDLIVYLRRAHVVELLAPE
jgi:carbamoyltransferase